MRLYHSATSPYARKVMVTILETGQQDDVTLVPAAGSPLDPGSMPLAQNPLGKIPTLERDEGPALFDSRVICRYLDARAGAGLYPDGDALWETLALEALADGILDAALLMVYESRIRPEALRMDEWTEGQWSKIARSLDALEGRWLAHLAGPFEMGQIALACALGYLDFRHASLGWQEKFPELAGWWRDIAKRPSFVGTAPPV